MKPRTKAVIAAVCQSYGCSLMGLRGMSRQLTTPRRLAWVLLQEHTNLSTAQIGKIFLRDHSAIVQGVAKFKSDYHKLHRHLKAKARQAWAILEICPEVEALSMYSNREKAAKAGAKMYTGVPCKRGHGGENNRYTVSANCVACLALKKGESPKESLPLRGAAFDWSSVKFEDHRNTGPWHPQEKYISNLRKIEFVRAA